MNIENALEIRIKYRYKDNLSETEEFLYTDALGYLITQTGNSKYMAELGGYYYAIKEYDLALKYYEMADENGNLSATDGLGYIWYYGRTGIKDYDKAFKYFSKCAEAGDDFAKYKIADMYKNGYSVEKDYSKYTEIIENLYKKHKNDRMTGDPVPEIFTRPAGIRKCQGKTEERIDLYLYAKDFLRQRIKYDAFWGNISIMNMLLDDLYTMMDFDKEEMDLFDLLYVLKKPIRIAFMYKNKQFLVYSEEADGEMAVHFNNKWYHSPMEFMTKRTVYGKLLCTKYEECYNFIDIEDIPVYEE